jgi:beta-glucosidase
VLRKEWGFEGFVTSDMSDIPKVAGGHFYATDNEDAAIKSISAGVDMELVGDLYKNLLPRALSDNKISMDVIDLSVKRILRAKIKLLGLSTSGTQPPAPPDPHSVLTDPTHDQLALQAAQEALVLLKNDNQTLPLDKSKVKNILVTGPLAKTVNLGGYSTTQPQFYINPVDGITADAGSGVTVTYQKGCNLENGDESQIPAAVDAARNADVVIAVIGQTTDQAKENLDRDNLDLVGAQEKLVEALQSTGKPVVVVLENGAPLSIVWIHDHIPAILESWYLGQDAGKAIAQALFGEINPGGKMPVSVPRNVGQVPCYYNHLPITGPVNFYGSTGGNLFSFGQGLSYTTFAYSNIQIQPSSIGPRDTAQVSVQVTNSGQRAGDEVVQLYINQKFTSVLRPVEELRGFQRVSLQPGESKTVTMSLGFEELKLWKDHGWVTEPGNVSVLIGGSSQDIKQAGVLELTQ